MPECAHCPICLGEFNDTDCIPYIGCQKGGHAFCKDCIFNMIPKSRHLDVKRIHEEPHAVYYNLHVGVPMVESQIQFNCPVCRENISLYDRYNVGSRSYPIYPVFTCQRIPLRYLKDQSYTPSRSIEERETARKKIAREITSKTIELEMMASTFAEMVTDFKETEGKQLAEVKEEYEELVQKSSKLEQDEAKLLNSIAALTRKRNAEVKVFNENMEQMRLEHEKNLSEINEKEKEMRETIEKNKDTLMGEMYRQARVEVQKEMEDDREKMMNEMLADCREQEEQFKIAMEARKADTELAYQIRRKNLERDIKLVERSLAKLNTQYEKMKEDAKGMTKHYYDEEMAKIKSMVAKSRQKIEHELEQFSATREEFGEYIKMKGKFMVRFREFFPQSYSYKWTTTQIKSDKEIMMWSILSELLDSEGSDSMKSIEDYMEFRIKNKNAKQNGRRWTNYSVDRWLKKYIKTEGGSIAGW